MKKIDNGVKNRLLEFILKDKTGMRKTLLWPFLQMNSCTTVEIYDFLIKQGFNVNYRAVSAMVGQMHSRLGILRFKWTNEHNVYKIKDDYLEMVMMILTSFNISMIDNNQVRDCVSLKLA